MNIKEDEIESKKQVGRIGEAPIVQVGLKGGLFLLFARRKGKIDTLGAGSHPAIARHIAKAKEPTIEWLDLAKADWPQPHDFHHLLGKYEAETERWAEALDRRQG